MVRQSGGEREKFVKALLAIVESMLLLSMEIALQFENAYTLVNKQNIDTAVYGVLAVMSELFLLAARQGNG